MNIISNWNIFILLEEKHVNKSMHSIYKFEITLHSILLLLVQYSIPMTMFLYLVFRCVIAISQFKDIMECHNTIIIQ
jgi:hypothetical protein